MMNSSAQPEVTRLLTCNGLLLRLGKPRTMIRRSFSPWYTREKGSVPLSPKFLSPQVLHRAVPTRMMHQGGTSAAALVAKLRWWVKLRLQLHRQLQQRLAPDIHAQKIIQTRLDPSTVSLVLLHTAHDDGQCHSTVDEGSRVLCNVVCSLEVPGRQIQVLRVR